MEISQLEIERRLLNYGVMTIEEVRRLRKLGGTTGNTEPNWQPNYKYVAGDRIADGTVVWQCVPLRKSWWQRLKTYWKRWNEVI